VDGCTYAGDLAVGAGFAQHVGHCVHIKSSIHSEKTEILKWGLKIHSELIRMI